MHEPFLTEGIVAFPGFLDIYLRKLSIFLSYVRLISVWFIAYHRLYVKLKKGSLTRFFFFLTLNDYGV